MRAVCMFASGGCGVPAVTLPTVVGTAHGELSGLFEKGTDGTGGIGFGTFPTTSVSTKGGVVCRTGPIGIPGGFGFGTGSVPGCDNPAEVRRQGDQQHRHVSCGVGMLPSFLRVGVARDRH